MAGTSARSRKRTILITLVTVLSLAGLGTALAYWTSSGSGTGTATTGESVAFTITSDPAVGEISPGSAGQTVDFTVTNPGTGTQNLANVTVTMADATGTAWVPPANCLIADYTVGISIDPVYGQIAAGGSVDGTATVTLATPPSTRMRARASTCLCTSRLPDRSSRDGCGVVTFAESSRVRGHPTAHP